MTEGREVSFEALDGRVMLLDAADYRTVDVPHAYAKGETEAGGMFRFRLDGVVYVAMEDPCDGYRSSMRSFFAVDGEADPPMAYTFPPAVVRLDLSTKGAPSYDGDERDHPRYILTATDVVTGGIVFEVGTDDTDDYYPTFVSTWNPENMAINAGKKQVDDIVVSKDSGDKQ